MLDKLAGADQEIRTCTYAMRKFWNKPRLLVLGLLLLLLVLWVIVRLMDAGGPQEWRGQNTQYHSTTLPDK